MGDKNNLQFHKYLVLGSFTLFIIVYMNITETPKSNMNTEVNKNKDSGMFENLSYIEIFFHFS